MRNTSKRGPVLVAGAVLALGLSACSGSSGTSAGTSASGAAGAANAAVSAVFNPSDTKGGTLRFGMAGTLDSVDPGDMYYGYSWNFVRNYARTLVVFKAAPGKAGNVLVPDLAESLGVPSKDFKTWTYKLKSGLKFEDGTPITSKDVKYAVARSLDKNTFPNGPTYFNNFLADVPAKYTVYPSKSDAGLTAIETPDDRTIIFHLKRSFSGFDYFAMLPQTAPVPAAKDTGAKYKEKVVSSGPYKFSSYEADKRYVLVRNENYDPATDKDSGRKALPDSLTVELGLNAADVDNRLQAGDLDIDFAGSGVAAESQAKILSNPDLKAKTDSAASARTWYANINSDVPPLDNIECRKAVLYGYDKTGYQRAYGGETGGDIATSLLPPKIPGHREIDLYDAKAKPQGDEAKAKAALAACGKPDGFETVMSYRAERPKEKNMAEAMQQSLAKIGIKLTLKGFPQGDYFKLYAGKPDFAKANGLGILTFGWAADWPDGFGALAQIVDSRTIRPAGNTNLGIKIPAVDALLDKALVTADAPAREKLWGDIDELVMENALVIPGIYAKGLLFRPATVTNIFINDAFGEYDYTAAGTSKK
ncbi:MAG TPA: ABC transporter substrate-binding protein [Candidatus Lustribacter sp.]|nr:ABC transporter substrate-binding protein [Candidatus Lustribacter sp.]